MESLKRMPWRVRMKALERLLSVADKANMTRKEQVAYGDSLVTMGYAHDEGFSKGRAKGKAEGLVEGRAEGKAEGILLVVRNMKAKGMDIEQISQLTGLSKEEIE